MKGYKLCTKEFESCLRKITMLGYGLIIIAHVDTRIEKQSDDSEVEIIGPAIPKRAYAVVNQLVDIIGYVDTEFNEEDGTVTRSLITRATPRVMAGSRFPHLPPKIPFGYEELSTALHRAIEMSGKVDGAVIVDRIEKEEEVKRPFDEVQSEARTLWESLVKKDASNSDKILEIVKEEFSSELKLSEITEKDQDLFEVVITKMRAL